MAKEFKNGERVEFRPWETAPAKDRVTGEKGCKGSQARGRTESR